MHSLRPPYSTTAQDRRLRGLRLGNGASVNSSVQLPPERSILESGVEHLLSDDNVDSDARLNQQDTRAMQGSAVLSHLHSTHTHESTSPNLMDLSNEHLESLITVDDTNGLGYVHTNSRPVINERLSPNHINYYSNGHITPLIGYTQPLQIQPYETNNLSKIDRTVIQSLINKLDIVDGSDEFQLVQFLKKVIPILHVSPVNSFEIIKLLVPKVSGQLFTLWINGIANRVDWDILHSTILDTFIPSLRRREIQVIEMDRPQKNHETLTDYCENVISAGFALKSTLTEKDVIDIIMNKCHPSNRQHFTFGTYPMTIQELRSLANRVTSAKRAESRYFGSRDGRYGNTDGYRHTSIHFNDTTRHTREPQPARLFTSNQGKQTAITCHRCRKTGHIARNCRNNLN